MVDKKRQIKREKIVSTLEEAKYSVKEWYVVPSSGAVHSFLVRNDLNNIEFLCFIPDNILMTVDTTNIVYCFPTSSPDFEMSQTLWNEISLENIAVKVFNGILFKQDTTWTHYSLSTDKKAVHSSIPEEIHAVGGLDETAATIVTSNPAVKIVDEKNPFDLILDGVDYQADPSFNTRVEDCQPSILVNYKGFTYGQAVPCVSVMILMNELKGFEIKLAKWNKEILTYQAAKLKTSSTEALTVLKRFLETLEKSVKDWETQWDTSADLLIRIQSIMEKTKETKSINDIQTKAGHALHETTEQIIQRRDNLVSLLNTCHTLFSQV